MSDETQARAAEIPGCLLCLAAGRPPAPRTSIAEIMAHVKHFGHWPTDVEWPRDGDPPGKYWWANDDEKPQPVG